MLQRDYLNYRLALLELLAKTFAVACIIGEAVLRVLPTPTPWFVRLAAYPIATIAYWTVRKALRRRRNAREAARLGAQLVPVIEGKWPGSLDIVVELEREMRNGYATLQWNKFFEMGNSNTVIVRMLWDEFIITRDDVHNRFILTQGFQHFEKGNNFKYIMQSLVGDSLFNTDGDQWKTQRAMNRPFFNKDRVADLLAIGKHADITINLIMSKGGQPVDVQDLFARFTLDAAFEFMFGQQLNTLKGRLPEAGAAEHGPKGTKSLDEFGSFAQAMDQTQIIIEERLMSHPIWMFREFLTDSMEAPMKTINAFVEAFVEQAFSDCQELQAKDVEVNVETCTMAQYFASHFNDRKAVRDQMTTMLLAGRDTTSCLLTFATYLLATNPDVFTKLRQHVLANCGTDHPPTLENIRQMKYLRAVIDETLRLFPPAPVSSRVAQRDILLPPSRPGEPVYFVPRGVEVAWFPLLTHRRSDIWGEDAEEFSPDRWLDEDVIKTINAHPGQFMSFGAGPRACIGQQFAYNEASFFLARLMQRVSGITFAPEAAPAGSAPPTEWAKANGRQAYEKCHPLTALILYSKGGMWLRFHAADSV
ncbi:cytochrome P450 monooxygenase CYP63 [Auriculariales sp. MPI-PUGE-AT-0066]|nr:cytochrome P450 monooxygenase CYP63 [Auriculariales sp. MPI-PUGE-AT-0066]